MIDMFGLGYLLGVLVSLNVITAFALIDVIKSRRK
jgi:hypothetical protein